MQLQCITGVLYDVQFGGMIRRPVTPLHSAEILHSRLLVKIWKTMSDSGRTSIIQDFQRTRIDKLPRCIWFTSSGKNTDPTIIARRSRHGLHCHLSQIVSIDSATSQCSSSKSQYSTPGLHNQVNFSVSPH